MMVKPFEKAAFEAKKGEYVIAETQYGFHIIQVLEKSKDVKKAEVASVQWRIEPSSATYQAVQNQAYQFAGVNNSVDKFNNAITKEGLVKRGQMVLKTTDRTIAGFDNAREIIRWAYKSKKGDVSQPFEFPDKFVVAVLTEVREKGYAPIEQIKEQLTTLVKKEKKAEKFIQEFKNNKSLGNLQAIAGKMNTPVRMLQPLHLLHLACPVLELNLK
jgi:peptidyl-prolyl cis-trans isomerase D